jgi:hypothetical protein
LEGVLTTAPGPPVKQTVTARSAGFTDSSPCTNTEASAPIVAINAILIVSPVCGRPTGANGRQKLALKLKMFFKEAVAAYNSVSKCQKSPL